MECGNGGVIRRRYTVKKNGVGNSKKGFNHAEMMTQ
jgi:hypothetical protein